MLRRVMPAPSSENISDPLYPPTRKFLPTVLLCLVSAALLIFAFPKTDIWFFSWIGFIPLMFALDGKKSAAAFGTAYLCGFLFFIGTLYWFIFMRDSAGVPGFLAFGAAILIALYLAIYFALFGWFYIYFSSRSVLVKMVLYSSVWASSEFLRDWIFTGFGWLCLGYSQYKVLPLIQIADITGVFGVSFLIMMVNYILKETFSSRKASQELGIAAFILLMVLGYGVMKLNIQTPSQGTAIIAVIQPNIAQQIKWEPSIWPLTMKKLQELTESTVSSAKANGQNIDLIIWPETSFPGYIWESPELYKELKGFVAKVNRPLLFGAIMKVGERYYNAAILLSKDGEVVKEYDKVHLVPFGEFIPFRNLLPWLSDVLGLADFTAGKEYAVFSLPETVGKSKEAPLNFSVLICFEDTIARLARRFVQPGADFLINITNDAWFGDSKEPFMHLQSSVFRAVENRRYMVRAANTGVSCFIDKLGRIYNYLENNRKKTFVTAFSVDKVEFESGQTFYTKFGDIFTYLCFGCILWGIVTRKMKSRRE